MLVVSELGEAVEADRYGQEENYREEIADAFIRLLDHCGAEGIDIEAEILKKMEVNEGREVKHGKVY
jgi:NTP pyrophosphatase (non-canonical NTP hydrolase)